jgi:hypothetical protein
MRDGFRRVEPFSGKASVVFLVLVLVTLVVLAGCDSRAAKLSYPSGGSIEHADLLIVTHPSLLEPVRRLAAYRTKTGTSTAVVTTEAIDKVYSGKDLQEKIRKCITDYWKKKGIKYVLLAGGSSLVPARYVFCPAMIEENWRDTAEVEKLGSPSEYELSYVPTDYYYANLIDNWDLNGNGVYGESKLMGGLKKDEGGFTSQVSVGRIPARSKTDLEVVVDKLIGYRPAVDRKALYISALNDAPSFNPNSYFSSVQGKLKKWAFSYIPEESPGFTAARVVDLLNAGGFNLFVSVAHGVPYMIGLRSNELYNFQIAHQQEPAESKGLPYNERWEKYFDYWFQGNSDPPFLNCRMVSGLNNAVPFFYVGYGCLTAYFTYKPHYSFAEQLVMQKSGAIAACGLSGGNFSDRPEWYSDALNYQGRINFEFDPVILENVCVKRMSLGPAIYTAISSYAEKHEKLMSVTDQRKAVYGTTLIGDPSMRLYR